MSFPKDSPQIDKGKVERTFALTVDFSVEEIELLIGKLKGRKNQLMGFDKNRNRDTIST